MTAGLAAGVAAASGAERVPALGDGAVEIVGAVAAAALLGTVLVVLLVVRRWLLVSTQGAFGCHVRTGGSGTSWRAGVARYEAARLAVFTTLALAWWPSLVLYRDRLAVVDRRSAADDTSGPSSATATTTILRCRYDGRVVEIAMDERVAGGFAVWVESGPPGRGINVA
jgi:hypothetical protein